MWLETVYNLHFSIRLAGNLMIQMPVLFEIWYTWVPWTVRFYYVTHLHYMPSR
jgi:hypothetical protein